jgi:hypothetical protein
MTIYTVIPFYFAVAEIFENDIQSFDDYDEAFYYACNKIDQRRFTIVKNTLNYKL